jgi:tetratricopeptide (TPR) repeat protein
MALLGLEPPPAGGRDALFAAWRLFFERIADQGTTVLVFEDLQWADSGLLDFIESLLEWSKTKPIFVLALTRPELYERRPGWGTGHRLATQMPLEPLPENAMRQLLGGLAPGLPEEAVAAILARADGIPLYAVETIRMLVSDGRLEPTDSGYRPTGELRDLAVPETLRSLIASRLDALDAVDRGLLQDGSVLGQRFTPAALGALSGVGGEDLEPRLRALVRREFLELEADPRSPERGQYGFVQSLIREVAYGTLARRDRRARHLAAARYYETLSDDELAGVLASHYLAAHEASEPGPEADALAVQARISLRAAAERAAALGGHAQAVVYLEQALAVSTDSAEREALLELGAVSANASGLEDKAVAFAREALDIHGAAGDIAAATRTSALMGRILLDYGRLDEAANFMEGAIESAGPDATGPEVADVLANLSRAYMRLDRNDLSIDTADRALSIAEPLNLERIVAEALINKASSMHRKGRLREAVALHELAVGIADASGFVDQRLRGRNNLSVAQIDNDPEGALRTIQEGIELARRMGQRGMFNWLVGTGALYSMAVGHNPARSLELLDETLNSSPRAYDRARALMIRAGLLARQGKELDQSLPVVEEAAAGITDGQLIGGLHYMRSLVAFSAGRWAEAVAESMKAPDHWHESDPFVLAVAMHALARTRREEDALAIKRRLDAFHGGSLLATTARIRATALVDALQGRDQDALAGFRAAIEAVRGVGAHLDTALAVVDALWLLPAESEVRDWVPFARETFERMEAAPYQRMLDDALAAAGGPTPPTPGPPVESALGMPAG